MTCHLLLSSALDRREKRFCRESFARLEPRNPRLTWYARPVRVLGVDYGRRRIGLALSDATGMLARPWKTIAARGNLHDVAADIVREIQSFERDDEEVGVVVLGLPRRLSGDPNEQTPIVEALAVELKTLTHLPIELQDERLSSHEAEELLSRREKDWRKRKPMLDAAAAAVILQDYLDARTRPIPETSGPSA